MSTPFLRGRPWNSAHVFNVSLPKLLRMAFPVFFVVFFAGNVGSLKTQISQKPERAKYLAKKKDKVKTQFVKGSAGVHLKRVQISGFISLKRRGYLDFCAVKCKNHGLAS